MFCFEADRILSAGSAAANTGFVRFSIESKAKVTTGSAYRLLGERNGWKTDPLGFPCLISQQSRVRCCWAAGVAVADVFAVFRLARQHQRHVGNFQ